MDNIYEKNNEPNRVERKRFLSPSTNRYRISRENLLWKGYGNPVENHFVRVSTFQKYPSNRMLPLYSYYKRAGNAFLRSIFSSEFSFIWIIYGPLWKEKKNLRTHTHIYTLYTNFHRHVFSSVPYWGWGELGIRFGRLNFGDAKMGPYLLYKIHKID